MIDKKIASLVRHLITVGAGVLAAKGVEVPQEAVESVISGATAIVLSLTAFGWAYAWSFFEKKRDEK